MIQREMERMQELGGRRNWERWKQLKTLLDDAYESEDEYWRRKSRVNWLQEGDKNTKFFYADTAERRKRNRLNMILREEETECKEEYEIAKESQIF